ncbi:MAG: hypothetical protein HGB12_01050 [Bacteroidetes bacterium]|nr:hypothetical protein [Bacteroidota bacterium]
MQNITSAAKLKNAIQLLEVEQAIREQLLKEQFHLVYESLKPFNLLKEALGNIVSGPYLINKILGPALGITSGFITKKIVVGASGNIFRKLFGSVLQFGVTKIVAQHPDVIKTFGQYIFQHIFTKNK